jgi:hypothetical protein
MKCTCRDLLVFLLLLLDPDLEIIFFLFIIEARNYILLRFRFLLYYGKRSGIDIGPKS